MDSATKSSIKNLKNNWSKLDIIQGIKALEGSEA